MFNRSTIFLGLMLTGSLAVASLMREEESVDSDIALPATAGRVQLGAIQPAEQPVLQLDKLARAEIADPSKNPFVQQSWYVPPPVVAPLPVVQVAPAVVVPTAPSFPFKYMGRIQEEGGALMVFLTRGEHAYSVIVGEKLDDSYLLESATPAQLVFVYLPLNIKQSVDVGGDFAAEDMAASLPSYAGRPMELVSGLGNGASQ